MVILEARGFGRSKITNIVILVARGHIVMNLIVVPKGHRVRNYSNMGLPNNVLEFLVENKLLFF